ncbi:DUF3375 domain-containing protein [Flexivirga caeni]|uniref:DUF3375 domain-containing protein n=1 Tax=Flexivirga caeni TaxID=2294115 RepID=A0A3M9M690_9MICO|nr:DUF3375 domain-containing protein [Flexivirga caeni]RNI21089.1 DUF3375 domain-containing protein [Flexivirga caeni]
MEFGSIESLRDRHPAWRLLRAGNASLVLAFLGDFFVDGNRGACPASELAAALDEQLYALNTELGSPDGERRFPKEPRAYLEDWAATEAGFLRRFYPPGDDEVHYEVTPAFEKAYAFAESLQVRPFVATESRLHTAVALLRQIVQGTDTDPESRLADLQRRRDELDAEIAAVEEGRFAVLEPSGIRDRYQQFTATARELLSDFREVEDNFRRLDRSAREKIATWDGAKGELLAGLVGSRSQITHSDQGHSFQAFYDFLLSQQRQDELTELLARVSALREIDADRRMKGIHHDWSEAAERAQRTVRQISEQLRRFLDDQVWLENRRVLDLVREVEAAALQVRDKPPSWGLEMDEPGIAINLPFERPLYTPPAAAEVESLIEPTAEEVDNDALFAESFVDPVRLLRNVRAILPEHSAALLSDIVTFYPVEQGAAEIVGYLALDDGEISVEMDDSDQTVLDYDDPADPTATKRARLPKVTVKRR